MAAKPEILRALEGIVLRLRLGGRHPTHGAGLGAGDAELVVALTVRAGQTQPEAVGCLQEKTVRQTICNVMEGGEKAFEQRYRRIVLEGRHV